MLTCSAFTGHFLPCLPDRFRSGSRFMLRFFDCGGRCLFRIAVLSIFCPFTVQRHPDFTGIRLYVHRNTASFHPDLLAGKRPYILRCVSGRQGHHIIAVVVVHRHHNGLPVVISGESILTIGQHQLLIVSVRDSLYLPAHFTQRSDQNGAGILLQRFSEIRQRKSGSQRIIGITFLFAFNTKFRAIVDRGNARKCVQQHMNRSEMSLIVQLRVNSFYIVIVHEIIQLQSLRPISAHAVQAFHRVGYLEVIMVIVSGVQSLVQIIISDGMQRPLIDPAGIIPVNDLAHKPELRFHLVRHMAQRSHIIEIQYICRVQTDTVDVELTDPEPHHIADVISHSRILLIQLGQQIVAAPVFIGEAVVVLVVPPEIHVAVPVLVRGVLPLLPDVLESKEVPACMVEHAVQDDPDSLPVAFRHISF